MAENYPENKKWAENYPEKAENCPENPTSG